MRYRSEMSEAANDRNMHDLQKARMRPYMTGNVTSGARPKEWRFAL